jgi:transcriptional repressor NF-X1
MKVKCGCGNLSRVVICCENEREYRRIRTSQLAAQMFRDENNYSNNNSIATSATISNDFSGKGVRLECNEECSQLERNRRMAVALQIENPDVTNRVNGPPKYSDFVKDFAKREHFFARSVHDSLAQLVAKTKESNNFKHRVHEFDCMGREKRQFVHELAAHFGCTTQSFDPEPNRNVVATAAKGEVWLPTVSVVEVAQGKKIIAPRF